MAPRYKVTAPTFIADALHVRGDVVEYAGWPGSSLEPTDDLGTKVKAHYDDFRRRGKKLPPQPDFAAFEEPAEEPKRKAPAARAAAVKDETDA